MQVYPGTIEVLPHKQKLGDEIINQHQLTVMQREKEKKEENCLKQKAMEYIMK